MEIDVSCFLESGMSALEMSQKFYPFHSNANLGFFLKSSNMNSVIMEVEIFTFPRPKKTTSASNKKNHFSVGNVK